MKRFVVLLLSLVSVFLVAETLVIKGSNTVFPIAQLWIEEFKKLHPDLQ